jgi:hypothetical protein
LSYGEVVPLDEGDVDARAHRGFLQELVHLVCFAENHLRSKGDHSALSPVLDDLSIPELRRGPEVRFPRTSSAAWPFGHLLSDPIHPEQGVSIVDELIARKQRDRPIGRTVYLLHQLIGVGLGSLANHKGRYYFGDGIEPQPDPGITVVGDDFLEGREVFLLFFTKLHSSSS